MPRAIRVAPEASTRHPSDQDKTAPTGHHVRPLAHTATRTLSHLPLAAARLVPLSRPPKSPSDTRHNQHHLAHNLKVRGGGRGRHSQDAPTRGLETQSAPSPSPEGVDLGRGQDHARPRDLDRGGEHLPLGQQRHARGTHQQRRESIDQSNHPRRDQTGPYHSRVSPTLRETTTSGDGSLLERTSRTQRGIHRREGETLGEGSSPGDAYPKLAGKQVNRLGLRA